LNTERYFAVWHCNQACTAETADPAEPAATRLPSDGRIRPAVPPARPWPR